MRDLTEQQQLFVVEFTTGLGAIGNASEAARRAGYSEKTAAEQGRQLLQKPHVKAAIEEANKELIDHTLATASLGVLKSILEDEKLRETTQGKKVLLAAAMTVLDRAGYVAPRAPEAKDRGEKSIDKMSIEELEQFVKDARNREVERRRQAGEQAPRPALVETKSGEA